MEIVKATNDDLPEMVELLKRSLGVGLVPKSEAYFLWKHIHNPFGASYTYLAKENNEIIGLRAFMQWQFKKNERLIKAVRAVDTATDPAHQGKGIFKKLTLFAVEACKNDGIDMVFNSPNNQSRPGYLKMGWLDNGRMPLYFGMGSVFPAKFNESSLDGIYQRFDVSQTLSPYEAEYVFPKKDRVFSTPITTNYLRWRYAQCPVAHYGAVMEKGHFGIVFRLKRLSRFIELRICEAWIEHPNDKKQLIAAFKKIKRAVKPALVSFAPDSSVGKLSMMLGPFNKGPITTIRPLAETNLEPFVSFAHWEPSIGVMELF